MPQENIIEIANFAAGVKDAPAFERSDGGASRMLNYLVDFDGEVVPREGYTLVSLETPVHITSGGVIDSESDQTGPFVVVDNTAERRFLFRLPEDATYVISKDKLFFAVPPQAGVNLNPSGYWVDVSGSSAITNADIYRWTNNTDAGGDAVRPTRDRVIPTVGNMPNLAPDLISHPTIIGLTGEPPNSQNPVEITFKTGQLAITKFQMSVKLDDAWSGDDVFGKWGYDADTETQLQLSPNKVYVFTWDGTDGNYTNAVDAFGNAVWNFVQDYWLWILAGGTGAVVDWLFVPDPDDYEDSGEPIHEISQEEFENCYLEIKYTVSSKNYKYRYYLYSHRGSNVAAQVGAALQTGLQVGQIGVQAAGPYGAIPGAAIAVAGTAGAFIGKAAEGVRVDLGRGSRQLESSAKEGGGFQHGQIVFCYTYSFDKDRLIETLPSRTSEIILHNFQNLQSGVPGRTRQRVVLNIKQDAFKTGQNALFDWANYINIYAARTDDLDADNKLPQETGLDFQLVKQYPLDSSETDGIPQAGGSKFWEDEELHDPSLYIECLDNDLPTISLTNIVSYGTRIWGVDVEDNSIRYSKLGPYGYHYFPNENTIVPQVISLDKDNSPIVKIHPASNDSMMYIFKSDVIHVLKGYGEIRGLYDPNTPIDINIDASIKIENSGTVSPRSICSLKNLTMFVGSDKILYSLSGTSVNPFSVSIQPYLDVLRDRQLRKIFAFEYRDMYFLCLPTEVLVLDIQKGYWTVFDWIIKDVFWARERGVLNNTVYAILNHNGTDTLVKLFSGTTDGGNRIDTEWESNPAKIPYASVISGIHVYHDENQSGNITVGFKSNNDSDYTDSVFTPAQWNRFRQGIHARGHRVQIRIKDTNTNKLRIDRIALETTQ